MTQSYTNFELMLVAPPTLIQDSSRKSTFSPLHLCHFCPSFVGFHAVALALGLDVFFALLDQDFLDRYRSAYTSAIIYCKLIEHSIRSLEEWVFFPVRLHGSIDIINPIRLPRTEGRDAKVPEFRIPSCCLPVDQSEPELASVLVFAILCRYPLQKHVLQLQVSMAELRRVITKGSFGHLSESAVMLWIPYETTRP